MNRFKSLYITIALVVHLLSVMSCVRIGCIQGNCINGQGTYTNADGDKYVGEWWYDKRNGQGTCTYANGNKYEGEWKEGEYNGRGTYTYADGSIKRGIWKNNEIVKALDE